MLLFQHAQLFKQPLYADEPVGREELKPLKTEVDFAKLPKSEPKEVYETLPYFTQVTKDVVVQEGKYARKFAHKLYMQLQSILHVSL